MRAGLLLTALAVASCKSPGAFPCASDDQCTPAGLGGVCESTGFCSFPDESCPSGRRYAGHAGGELADTCVGETGPLPDARADAEEPIGVIDAPPDAGAAGDGAADGPPDDGAVGGCIVAGDGCLEQPSDPVSVFEGGADLPANYACAPESLDVSAMVINVSGTLRDSFAGGPRANATIDAYRDVLATMALATDTSDGAGAYDLVFPIGSPDFLSFRIRHAAAVDSFYLNEVLILNDPDQPGKNFSSFSSAHLSALATQGSVVRDPDDTVYYADLYDCDGNGVEHAIGILSTVSSAAGGMPVLVGDTVTIYLDAAALPTPRTLRTETNRDGHFFVFQAPQPPVGTDYFLQAWGFLSAADEARGAAGLSLLSEFKVPVPAASYVRIGLRATEGPLP